MAPALTNGSYANTAADSVTDTTRASSRQSAVGTLQSARRATLRSRGESDITISLSHGTEIMHEGERAPWLIQTKVPTEDGPSLSQRAFDKIEIGEEVEVDDGFTVDVSLWADDVRYV